MERSKLILPIFLAALLLVGCLHNKSEFSEPAGATTEPLPAEKAERQVNSSNVNVELGISYLQAGNIQRAKSKLLLALQQAPHNPAALDGMAYYLEQTGEAKEAEQYYLKALNAAPKSGNAQNNYGAYLCRNSRYQEAVKHFMLAVKDPAYLSVSEAYENAGICALKIPDEAKAIEYLKKANLQDPTRSAPLLELAMVMYKKADFSLANQYFERYLQREAAPSQAAVQTAIIVAQKLGDAHALAYYNRFKKVS